MRSKPAADVEQRPRQRLPPRRRLSEFCARLNHRSGEILSHPCSIKTVLCLAHGEFKSAAKHAFRMRRRDQDHEIIALRHTEDAVVVECWLTGTHRGAFGPIPPTGNKFRVRMAAFFIFDQQEKLVCERIYFDALTMFKQLLAGKSVKNPRDWPFFVKAIRGLMAVSGDQPHPDLVNTPVAQFPGYVHKPAAERV